MCLAVTALLSSGLPRMTADFSNDSYLLPGDETRQQYDEFRDRFGLDDRIVVALEPKEVFDTEFLETLRVIHREIEEQVPYVEDVLSLINARNTRGEGDELIVEDLLETWPEGEAALTALRQKVLASPTYRNNLISEDGRYTVLLIRAQTYSSMGRGDEALAGFDGDSDVEEGESAEDLEYLSASETDALVTALYEVAARHGDESMTIRLAGESVIGHRAKEISSRDSAAFTVAGIVIIIVVLYGLFRRISAALLPSFVIVLCLLSTFGTMAWLGIPFSIPTQIVPSFLIAVAVCDAVHVLTIFFQAHERGEERGDALAHTLGHSGLAIVMTSLTTAAGLFSFQAAQILPVARLGIVAPIGVLIALVYTMTLLPACLSVIPLSTRAGARRSAKGSGEVEGVQTDVLTRQIVKLGVWVSKHPKIVLAAATVVVLVSATGVARIRFSHDPNDWLLPDDPVRIAVSRMDEALRGVSTVEILIDTGRENGLYDPDILRRVEAAGHHALQNDEGLIPVGSVLSIVEIVKEINQALNANDADFYRLPDNRELIAQELLLFENSGSDDLLEVTDSQFQVARLTLKVPLVDAFYYGDFLASLDADLREILGPDLSLEMTGATVLGSRTFSVVVTSMARSYSLALLIITPLMILMIGSLRIGLLSMIPNLLPVFVTLALMGWCDIPLGMSTLLVGSIVIGLAVDDTIHFLHRFDRYNKESGDPAWAIEQTLATTGRALFVTSVVLAASFGIFGFGRMTGTALFGLLASFATISAFLADITISPALLLLVSRRRPEGANSAQRR